MGISSNRPPPATWGERCRIGVLERNRTVAQRMARVMRAASGLFEVVAEADPATLRSAFSDEPSLLACDVSDLDLALEWAENRYKNMSIITWTSSAVDPVLEAAARSPRVAAVIGWPEFASTPRPWEVAIATRRIVVPSAGAPRLSELFTWGATIAKYRPRTSHERDLVVAEVGTLAERAGAGPRVAQRIGEVAHELLMNAMYDAPIDESGRPRYAHDRKRDIELYTPEVPTFRFASDGLHIGLQVVDPFGRLTRSHVLRGIERGRRGNGEGPILDTSGGGAGLGLYRIYAQSTVMLVDVVPERYTSVTAFFDLDKSPREMRSVPISLHLYDAYANDAYDVRTHEGRPSQPAQAARASVDHDPYHSHIEGES